MTVVAPRRDQVLRDVVAALDERLDGVMPLDVPGVEQTFRDAATLADVLYVRWHATLATQLDRALADDPHVAAAAAVRAWRRTARELPGVRLALDRHHAEADGRERTRLDRRVDRQRQWLAVRAGLAPESRAPDEAAVALGAELEAEGRRYFNPRGRSPRRSLVARLRSVLAA